MNSTVDALKNLYVALGGDLDDTYETICDGAKVNDYILIPDMINAIAELKSA